MLFDIATDCRTRLLRLSLTGKDVVNIDLDAVLDTLSAIDSAFNTELMNSSVDNIIFTVETALIVPLQKGGKGKTWNLLGNPIIDI